MKNILDRLFSPERAKNSGKRNMAREVTRRLTMEQLERREMLAASDVFHFAFEGDVTDNSGQGNNGVLERCSLDSVGFCRQQDGVAVTPAFSDDVPPALAGKSTQSIELGESHNYLVIPEGGDGLQEFTFSTWVKPDAQQPDGVLFSSKYNANGSSGTSGWMILREQGQLKLTFKMGSSWVSVPTGVAIPVDAWSHIAVSRTAAGAGTVYLNGAAVHTFTLTGTIDYDADNRQETLMPGRYGNNMNEVMEIVLAKYDEVLYGGLKGDAEIRAIAQGEGVIGGGGNTPPNVIDDASETYPYTPKVIDVLANDTDANGDALIVTSVQPSEHSTVVINADGTVTYTPKIGFRGQDTFTYTVSDGQENGETAGTATVEVKNILSAGPDPVWAMEEGAAPTSNTIVTGVNTNDLVGRTVLSCHLKIVERGRVVLWSGYINNAMRWDVEYDSSNGGHIVVQEYGGVGSIATRYSLDAGDEADIEVVYDDNANTVKILINGVLDTEAPVTMSFRSGATLTVNERTPEGGGALKSHNLMSRATVHTNLSPEEVDTVLAMNDPNVDETSDWDRIIPDTPLAEFVASLEQTLSTEQEAGLATIKGKLPEIDRGIDGLAAYLRSADVPEIHISRLLDAFDGRINTVDTAGSFVALAAPVTFDGTGGIDTAPRKLSMPQDFVIHANITPHAGKMEGEVADIGAGAVLQITPTGTVRLRITQEGQEREYDDTTIIDDAAGGSVTVQKRGNTLTFFHSDGTTHAFTLPSSAVEYGDGGNAVIGEGLHGTMEQLSIANHSLTKKQIAALQNGESFEKVLANMTSVPTRQLPVEKELTPKVEELSHRYEALTDAMGRIEEQVKIVGPLSNEQIAAVQTDYNQLAAGLSDWTREKQIVSQQIEELSAPNVQTETLEFDGIQDSAQELTLLPDVLGGSIRITSWKGKASGDALQTDETDTGKVALSGTVASIDFHGLHRLPTGFELKAVHHEAYIFRGEEHVATAVPDAAGLVRYTDADGFTGIVLYETGEEPQGGRVLEQFSVSADMNAKPLSAEAMSPITNAVLGEQAFDLPQWKPQTMDDIRGAAQSAGVTLFEGNGNEFPNAPMQIIEQHKTGAYQRFDARSLGGGNVSISKVWYMDGHGAKELPEALYQNYGASTVVVAPEAPQVLVFEVTGGGKFSLDRKESGNTLSDVRPEETAEIYADISYIGDPTGHSNHMQAVQVNDRPQEPNAFLYPGGTYGVTAHISNPGTMGTSATVQFVSGITGRTEQSISNPITIPLSGLQTQEILHDVIISDGTGKPYIYLAAVLPDGRSSSEMDTGRHASEKRTYSDRDFDQLMRANNKAIDAIAAYSDPRIVALYKDPVTTIARLNDQNDVYASLKQEILVAGGAPIEREVLVAALSGKKEEDDGTPPDVLLAQVMEEERLGLMGAAEEVGDLLVSGGIVEEGVVERDEVARKIVDVVDRSALPPLALTSTEEGRTLLMERWQTISAFAGTITHGAAIDTNDLAEFDNNPQDAALIVQAATIMVEELSRKFLQTSITVRGVAMNTATDLIDGLWTVAEDLSLTAKAEIVRETHRVMDALVAKAVERQTLNQGTAEGMGILAKHIALAGVEMEQEMEQMGIAMLGAAWQTGSQLAKDMQTMAITEAMRLMEDMGKVAIELNDLNQEVVDGTVDFVHQYVLQEVIPLYMASFTNDPEVRHNILKDDGPLRMQFMEYDAENRAITKPGKLVVVVNGHLQDLGKSTAIAGMNNVAQKLNNEGYEVLHFRVGIALGEGTDFGNAWRIYDMTQQVLEERLNKQGIFRNAPDVTTIGLMGYSWGGGTVKNLSEWLNGSAYSETPVHMAMIDAVELGSEYLAMPAGFSRGEDYRPPVESFFSRYQTHEDPSIEDDLLALRNFVHGPLSITQQHNSMTLFRAIYSVFTTGNPAHGRAYAKWEGDDQECLGLEEDHFTIDDAKTRDRDAESNFVKDDQGNYVLVIDKALQHIRNNI